MDETSVAIVWRAKSSSGWEITIVSVPSSRPVRVASNNSGAHSHVSACKRNFIDDRELRALGDLGSYVSKTIDIQAQDIFAGKRPVDDLAGWGYEPKENWWILATENGRKVIPSEQGRYHDY